MAGRKHFETGRTGSRLSETLAQRYQRDAPTSDLSSEPVDEGSSAVGASAPAPLTPVPDTPPAQAPMVTRSWYLHRETADRLAAAADDLRHTVPALTKADALDALITAGIDRRDEVATALLERARSARRPR